MLELTFQTHPSRYRHWQLSVAGKTARLVLNVDPKQALDGQSELKMNSYDLGVDIELADAVDRLRFEHPEVRAVCVASGHDRVFCAGANIPTLAGSSQNVRRRMSPQNRKCGIVSQDLLRYSDIGQKHKLLHDSIRLEQCIGLNIGRIQRLAVENNW